MKRICGLVLFGILATVLAAQEAPAQAPDHFYNVDKEIRLDGTVQEIRLEPRYKDRAPFLILVLRTARAGELYTVEVSPSWFFGQDLHEGERLTVLGSLAAEGTVLARQLRVRGETVIVRDKRGFPSWGAGAARQRGKRRIGGI